LTLPSKIDTINYID